MGLESPAGRPAGCLIFDVLLVVSSLQLGVGFFFWGWAVKNMVNGNPPFDSGCIIFLLAVAAGACGVRIWWRFRLRRAELVERLVALQTLDSARVGEDARADTSPSEGPATGRAVPSESESIILAERDLFCCSALTSFPRWAMAAHGVITLVYLAAAVALKRSAWFTTYCWVNAASWGFSGVLVYPLSRRVQASAADVVRGARNAALAPRV